MSNIQEPILVINLKTYPEGTGNNAHALLKAAEEVSDNNVILAVQAIDIRYLSEHSKIPIFAQHIDPFEEGNRTGSITAQAIKDAGAKGTLINHSEKRIPSEQIGKTVEICRKHGLKTIICAESPEEAEKLSKYNPDYIAIEPPELIGGDISVSTAKPEVITNTVERIKHIHVLCGAGVKNEKDSRIAVKLGSRGLLVASGIVKSKDQKKAIQDLLNGFK